MNEEYTANQSPEWESAGFDVAAFLDAAAQSTIFRRKRPPLDVAAIMDAAAGREVTPAPILIAEILEELPEMTVIEEILEELPEMTVVEEVQEELPEMTVIEEIQEELPEMTVVEEVLEKLPEMTVVEGVQEELPEMTVIEEVQEELPEMTVVEEVREELPEMTVVEEVQEEFPEMTMIERSSEEIPEESAVIEEEPILVETASVETQKAIWEDEDLIQLQEILDFADRGCTLQQLMARYDRLGKIGSQVQGVCREGERALSAQEAARALEQGNILHWAVDSSALWGIGAPMGGPVKDGKMADHWVAFTGVRRNSDGSFRDFELMDEGELRFVTASQYTAMCFGSQMTDPVCFLVGKAAATPDGQAAPEMVQAPSAQVWEVDQPFAQDELYARFAVCPEDSDQAFEWLRLIHQPRRKR